MKAPRAYRNIVRIRDSHMNENKFVMYLTATEAKVLKHAENISRGGSENYALPFIEVRRERRSG